MNEYKYNISINIINVYAHNGCIKLTILGHSSTIEGANYIEIISEYIVNNLII